MRKTARGWLFETPSGGVAKPPGKLLVRLICSLADASIAEVRSDAEQGPVLWYRVNILRSALKQREADVVETPVEGEVHKVNQTAYVHLTQIEDGDIPGELLSMTYATPI
ncbi:MAG: hypothetical protein M3O29_01445, partial [Actinomycetota bacterium]|nr:hypothetical protein [Actinomycetota bacterium]